MTIAITVNAEKHVLMVKELAEHFVNTDPKLNGADWIVGVDTENFEPLTVYYHDELAVLPLFRAIQERM